LTNSYGGPPPPILHQYIITILSTRTSSQVSLLLTLKTQWTGELVNQTTTKTKLYGPFNVKMLLSSIVSLKCGYELKRII